jgi:hypothetical protein
MIHQRRSGFTLFQLLVVLALLLLFLAMLFPAVVKVRAVAEQANTVNNLKQLGLALHNYNDTYTMLPPGVDENHFSATAKLLPFVEQDNVFRMTNLKKSIDDAANADVRAIKIKMLLSPRDPIESVNAKYGATNYLFNDQVFFLNSKSRIPASFPDGTSNTIVTGETLKGDGANKAQDVKRQYVLLKKEALKDLKEDAGVQDFKDNKNIAGDRCASWMDGRFLQGMFNGRLKLNDPRPDVSCAGAGGASTLRSLDDTIHVGIGDGSVRTLNAKKLTFATWTNALCPNDGNPLGNDW